MKPTCPCLFVEKAGKDEVSSGRRGKSSFFLARRFFFPALSPLKDWRGIRGAE